MKFQVSWLTSVRRRCLRSIKQNSMRLQHYSFGTAAQAYLMLLSDQITFNGILKRQ